MECFEKTRFVAAGDSERGRLCTESASAIALRLQSSAVGFHDEVLRIVKELRRRGHDLSSFDEEDDFEVWGPDYHAPSGSGLLINFSGDRVDVHWVAQ